MDIKPSSDCDGGDRDSDSYEEFKYRNKYLKADATADSLQYPGVTATFFRNQPDRFGLGMLPSPAAIVLCLSSHSGPNPNEGDVSHQAL